MRHLLLLPIFLLASSQAIASNPPAGPVGLWQGEVGKLPVVACFDAEDRGLYYYLRNGKLLVLRPDEDGLWQEEALGKARLTGHWRLDPPAGDTLSGEWNTADGKHATPVRLKRLALDNPHNAESPCQDAAFNAARLRATVRKPGKQQKIGTLPIREFAALDVSGQLLVEPAPTPLGRALQQRFDAMLAESYDCEVGISVLDAPMREGFEFTRNERLLQVSASFVVIGWSGNAFCGGAHPDDGWGGTTLRRDTGETVQPALWFKAALEKGISAKSALGKLIRSQYRELEGDCPAEITAAEVWSIWPRRAGMVFQPVLAHVARGCTEDATVPWPKLSPHLSEAGQQLMQEMRTAAP